MFIALVLFGLVLGGAVYLALTMFARSDVGRLVTAVTATSIGFGVLGVLLLLLGSRGGMLLLAVAGALYLIYTLHGWWVQQRGGSGAAEGHRPPIVTKYLNVVADANTGKLYGTVLAGRFRSRRLTELSLEQLLEVREQCRHDDVDAALLIEAYLDQVYGAAWKAKAEGGPFGARPANATGSDMTREEAYEVLGLKPGASDAEVREAHHRLMLKLHPDQGGSDYLARRINHAKDVLLGA
jgi:DnaJ domain